MKHIPLSRGKFALVDDEDYSSVSRFSWWARPDKSCKQEIVFYANTEVNGKTIPMHRFILKPEKDMIVDHVNRNPLDNRRSNLRLCSRSQNAANRRKFSNNTSGRKGVVWHKRIKKWQARVQFEGKQNHLGYFDSLEEADKAYKEKAKDLHGDFASL